MNKKLLLGAALLVGMGTTFTSCVDSTESPSVTAIRDAKAEQLKSIAELNKALAEKELIIANADKAAQAANQAYQEAQAKLLAAQAEYELAQAELLRAQAAYLNAQTAAEQAKLEYELKLMQAELDKKGQELAQAKADLEAQQKRLEIELQRLEAELDRTKISAAWAQFAYDQMVKNAEKAETEAEKEALRKQANEIRTLITNYNTAAEKLATAKQKLAKDEFTLARYQAGFEKAQTVLKDKILELQNTQNELNKKVQIEQAMIDTYSKYAGTLITEDIVEYYRLAYVEAQSAFEDAYYDQYQPAYYAAWDAEDALTGSDYQKAVDVFMSRRYSGGAYTVENAAQDRKDRYTFYVDEIEETNTDAPVEARGKICLVLTTHVYGTNIDGDTKDDDIVTYTPIFEPIVDSTEENANGSKYPIYVTYNSLIDNGSGLDAWLNCKLAQLKNSFEANGLKAAQDELADAQAFLTQAIKDRDEANTNYAAAVKKNEELKNAAATAQAKQEPAWDAWAEANSKLTEESTDADRKAVADLAEAYNKAVKDAVDAQEAYTGYAETLSTATTAKALAISAVDYGTAWVSLATKALYAAEAGESSLSDTEEMYKEMVANIKNLAKENEDLIKADNEAWKELSEVVDEVLPLQDEADVADSNFFIISIFKGTYLGGIDEANDVVETAEANIKDYNEQLEDIAKEIAKKQAILDDLNTNDGNWEKDFQKLILDAQTDVDVDKVSVANAQQAFDFAKAQLEAALAEQQK